MNIKDSRLTCPNDGYGVCTDVVAFALKDAGYDLMTLVYFDSNAISLTTDINQIEEWLGGDIVVFKNHIGIVSDHRNKKGINFVIHHVNPYQKYYEEDIFEYRHDIVGHYRMS